MAETEPSPIAPKGIPHGAKANTAFQIHKVEDGDDLDKLAKSVGVKGPELAEFNWGTSDSSEINWYLANFVGCTPKTGTGSAYTLTKSDSPGLIYLPAVAAKPAAAKVARKPPADAKHAALVPAPLNLEVTEIAFHDDFDLHKWDRGTKSGGAMITGPVWKKVWKPKDHLPVCYKRKSKGLKLQVKVKVLSGTTKGTLTLRATGLTRSTKGNPKKRAAMSAPLIFEEGSVPFKAPEMTVKGIKLLDGGLSDKVMISEVYLRWSYSLDKKTWFSMPTTGPHKIYQVDDTPLENPLYDFALEKACGYVNGEPDVPECVSAEIGRLNPTGPQKGKRTDCDVPEYKPSAIINYMNPLEIYKDSTGAPAYCLCWDYADLMRYLCRSVGDAASLRFMWGGTASNNRKYYLTGSDRTRFINNGRTIDAALVKSDGDSFQVKAEKNGKAEKDPHFTYHALTVCNTKTYDPTYGKVSNLTTALPCKAPGCSRQLGTSWPPSNHTAEVTWSCAH